MATKMVKKFTNCFLILVCLSLIPKILLGASSEVSETEKQQYKEELVRIEALGETFTPGQTNDLKKYEEFADQIKHKWEQGNKELYARLMLEVCKPLSSGTFKEDSRYEAARQYALSALTDVNSISIETELELTGHVITLMIGPNAPEGKGFAQRRKKDVEIRLHAWKRLIDAIDPNWDPNETLVSPNVIAGEMGFLGAVEPESIHYPNLRAEYETAIQKNQQKIERYSEQNRLHDWLKRFPRHAEPYIIEAYSKPPFNLQELQQFLNDYLKDDKIRHRILEVVSKNIEHQTQNM